MEDKLLILLTKLPEAGNVKSRLSGEIGPEKAAMVYDRLLLHTLGQMKMCIANSCVALEGRADVFREKYGQWEVVPQHGANLGARMMHAFEMAFSQKHEKVVLIGGDCPEITPEILESAFEKLNGNDLVLGPSQDGGYYLIGLKKPEPKLFENMQWSHERVLEETIQRAKTLRLKVAFMPVLRDIDHLADLNAFPSFAP